MVKDIKTSLKTQKIQYYYFCMEEQDRLKLHLLKTTQLD